MGVVCPPVLGWVRVAPLIICFSCVMVQPGQGVVGQLDDVEGLVLRRLEGRHVEGGPAYTKQLLGQRCVVSFSLGSTDRMQQGFRVRR